MKVCHRSPFAPLRCPASVFRLSAKEVPPRLPPLDDRCASPSDIAPAPRTSVASDWEFHLRLSLASLHRRSRTLFTSLPGVAFTSLAPSSPTVSAFPPCPSPPFPSTSTRHQTLPHRTAPRLFLLGIARS